jgi:hypothetical protein
MTTICRRDERIMVDIRVEDDPLKFEFHGRCGFAAGFDYRS